MARSRGAGPGGPALPPALPPGAQRAIPRRDFLQGTLVAAAGSLCGPLLHGVASAAESELPAAVLPDYPPALTGLRGAHPGSFEAAHARRDGSPVPPAEDSGERYDLIVVGAGISGLAAAHFYRQRFGAARRILILDNHDDFGGHAKRNEFTLAGRMQLVNGGTLDIDSPRPYSAVARGLLAELGVDVPALSRRIEHRAHYAQLGLKRAVFFDRETFGADRLVAGFGTARLADLLRQTPLSAAARADLMRIEHGHEDYLPGLTSAQKKERLAGISYRAFLRDCARVDPAVLAYYQRRSHGEWAVGIDAVSALDLWGYGYPGFQGLGLDAGITARMGPTAAGYHESGGSPRLHFPDGNATLARLLVRRLLPACAAGSTVEEVTTARFDYSALDRPGSPVRLRLLSTVVRVAQTAASGAAPEVQVSWVRSGRAYVARARHTVLACWNVMIPYLCPQLPESQKAALHSLVKAPLVYANVALSNWRAFAAAGASEIYAPGSYFSNLYLNPRVDIGAYQSPTQPAEPIVLRLERAPCQPGLSEREQNRAGRAELLATSFARFESEIRAQLARMLGPFGLDPARDILAITVNRWPHGYAPEYNSLFDPLLPEAQQPQVLGRAPCGQISIANSDSGAAAYTDAAIDQAHRAVSELPA